MTPSSSRLALCLLLPFALAAVPGGEAAASVARPPAPDAVRAREALAQYRNRAAAALALADGEDHAAADQALTAVIADPLLDALAPGDRYRLLSAAGLAALQAGDNVRARGIYRRAIAIDAAAPGEPDDWYRLAFAEQWSGEHEAAATHLVRMVEGWPEFVDNLDVQLVATLLHDLDDGSQARLDLLQALFDAGWTRGRIGASTDWQTLALMRLQRGEIDLARAAIARITDPDPLAKIASDRRFDAALAGQPPLPAVEDAALHMLERLREQAGREPRRLSLQSEVSYALLALGRNQEAIDLADALLARIAAASDGDPPFDDVGEQVWLANNRAIAMRRLGRTDEALGELVRASGLDENGETNVSQVLNLAQFQCSLGRPRDALATLARVGENMSDYGRMVRAAAQQCAALAVSDAAMAGQAMAYLRAHRDDARPIFLVGLVRANRMDEAAATLVALLDSEDGREDILLRLQDYREPAPLPGDAEAERHWQALVARADVQAAIARVGRVHHYDLWVDNWSM
ncbi:MAG TPA: hypothetical protein VM619_03600 [Luteimonas sp.]|nr:hypothetical protein [Luteimonas sp.]